MYTKDLKHKMTLRLNDELYEYVNEMSDKYQLSPSDFIRQCIAQNLDARKMTQAFIKDAGASLQKKIDELKEGGLDNGIDRKTDLNNLV